MNHQMAAEIQMPGLDPRPHALLVNTAYQLPSGSLVVAGTDRLGLGVRFIPWGSNGLILMNEETCTYLRVDPDADGNYEPTFEGVLDRSYESERYQKAFGIVDALTCTAIESDHATLRDRVTARIELVTSEALALEMVHGYARAAVDDATHDLDGEGAHTLPSDAQVVTGADASLTVAMVELEEFLATALHGGVGMLHVSPGVLSNLMATDGIRLDDGVWRTATGHRVVADAGYANMPEPDGESAPTSAERWIYATGPVWWDVDDVKSMGAPNQESMTLSHDDLFALMKRKGVVLWDPATVGAFKVDITA